MPVMVGIRIGAALVHVPMARLTAVPDLRLPHRFLRLRLGPVRQFPAQTRVGVALLHDVAVGAVDAPPAAIPVRHPDTPTYLKSFPTWSCTGPNASAIARGANRRSDTRTIALS